MKFILTVIVMHHGRSVGRGVVLDKTIVVMMVMIFNCLKLVRGLWQGGYCSSLKGQRLML